MALKSVERNHSIGLRIGLRGRRPRPQRYLTKLNRLV